MLNVEEYTYACHTRVSVFTLSIVNLVDGITGDLYLDAIVGFLKNLNTYTSVDNPFLLT